MKKDTVVSLKKPAEESDPLSSLLREGARALLHDAVEAELATYLAEHGGERDAAGRWSIVQNGYLPVRTLLTGLGEAPIRLGLIEIAAHGSVLGDSEGVRIRGIVGMQTEHVAAVPVYRANGREHRVAFVQPVRPVQLIQLHIRDQMQGCR